MHAEAPETLENQQKRVLFAPKSQIEMISRIQSYAPTLWHVCQHFLRYMLLYSANCNVWSVYASLLNDGLSVIRVKAKNASVFPLHLEMELRGGGILIYKQTFLI